MTRDFSGSTSSATIYPLDLEHSGLRFVVIAAFVVVGVIAFMLASVWITSDGLNLIAIAIGFAAAYGASVLAERALKGRWSSGRAIAIDRDGVQLTRGGAPPVAIRADQPADLILWRFEIRKRARVPKGWYVLACALEQGDEALAVYAFFPPEVGRADERGSFAHDFTRLTPRPKETANRGSQVSLRGTDPTTQALERVRAAEQGRWLAGAEMTADDFKAYVLQIRTAFIEWKLFTV